MAFVRFCVAVLTILFSSETFMDPVSSSSQRLERSDDPQPLAAVVENLASRVARLEASNTEMQNQLAAKRCESGVIGFAPHTQPNVTASDGRQTRTHKLHVSFSRPFATMPWVSVGLNGIDEYNTANLRIVLGVDAVFTSGFDAHAYEWSDTNVKSVTAFWVACNV